MYEVKETLIQHVKGNKYIIKETENRDLESIKRNQTMAYYMKGTKKQKQENLGLEFLGLSMHVHTQALYAGQLYAYAYFELAYACRSMCMQTRLKP